MALSASSHTNVNVIMQLLGFSTSRHITQRFSVLGRFLWCFPVVFLAAGTCVEIAGAAG